MSWKFRFADHYIDMVEALATRITNDPRARRSPDPRFFTNTRTDASQECGSDVERQDRMLGRFVGARSDASVTGRTKGTIAAEMLIRDSTERLIGSSTPICVTVGDDIVEQLLKDDLQSDIARSNQPV